MERKREVIDWPSFDAPLLKEFAAALLSRRKAIAYHTVLTCEREFTESQTGAIERLSLDTRILRLSIWSDGEMWLSVHVRGLGRNAGWAFKDEFHGDVCDVSAEAIVGMVEATLSIPFGTDSETSRQRLRDVWARLHPHAG